MRHQRVINHLGRKSSHRKAMLSNMAASLILHKRITTTVAKAKALKTFVEPVITKSKEDSTHSRRVAFSYLQDKTAVSELFREVSPKIGERPGGYTRILKTGNRIGDNAEMCILELVDFNENMLAGAEAKPKAARRRRASKKKEGGDEVKAIRGKRTASSAKQAEKAEAKEVKGTTEAPKLPETSETPETPETSETPGTPEKPETE
ncbi:MAG: 50S ribosomal protein L17 [Bacteroidales bacterium]|nr:50S ribosomal protein L17 [Bacteroidales bacterium]